MYHFHNLLRFKKLDHVSPRTIFSSNQCRDHVKKKFLQDNVTKCFKAELVTLYKIIVCSVSFLDGCGNEDWHTCTLNSCFSSKTILMFVVRLFFTDVGAFLHGVES